MIAQNQKFENITIYLDGCSFYGCRFEGCNLVFNGVLGFVMENPSFQSCSWTPQGPALQTLQLLGTLYKGGATDLIDRIFHSITGEQGAPISPRQN